MLLAADQPDDETANHNTPVAKVGEDEKEEKKDAKKDEKNDEQHDEKPDEKKDEKKDDKQDEKKDEKKEESPPSPAMEQEPETCAPIPGSETWGWTKSKKHTQKCEEKKFSCHRGCKYIVEDDKCDQCEGHNVSQADPEKEVEGFQQDNGQFRIPSGVDSYGWGVRGCTKKNSVLCYDQERKKNCCCNLGYIFNFESRECVADEQDPANKEESIPGSQLWGRMKRKGSADKCVQDTSHWCCHRSCSYELDKDKCGRCNSYDQKPPTTVAQILLDWEKSNGPYLIPPSIDKPGMFGGCSTKNTHKCVAQNSKTKHCCCNTGFVFSFQSRLCVSAAELQQEQQQQYQEMQSFDQAAASDQTHQGPPPPIPSAPAPGQPAQPAQPGAPQQPAAPAPAPADHTSEKQAAGMAAKAALKASGYGAAAPQSLVLVLPMITLSLMRGLWLA